VDIPSWRQLKCLRLGTLTTLTPLLPLAEYQVVVVY